MRRSLKLLLLGDSLDDAEAVVAELQRNGYEPAWRRVDSERRLRSALRSRWDLVVSDFRMTDLDGLRALDIVRHEDAAVPFVLVSDPVGEQTAVAAMRRGVRDCLQRSDLSRLAGVVAEALDHAARDRKQLAAASAMAFQQNRYHSVFQTAPVALMEADLSGARRLMDLFADATMLDALEAEDELVATALDRIRVLAANSAAVELLGAGSADALTRSGAGETDLRSLWLEVLDGLKGREDLVERNVRVPAFDGHEIEVRLLFRRPATAAQMRNVVIGLVALESAAGAWGPVEVTQRMEAVGRLTARVAHDFNNHLTVIQGYAGLLLDTLEESNPALTDLRTIGKAASAAEELTEQLMACSRPLRWEPEPLDLNSQISHLSEALQATLGEGVTMSTILGDGLWEVSLDPIHFEQLLRELAANACSAMPAGGKLTVETGNTYLESVEPVPPGDYVMLTLADTGEGMSEETLHRSFEPFFTTRRNQGHAGLGLSMAHAIVRQARGLIWARSHPGAGTTLEVLLPALDAAAEGAAFQSRT